MNRTGEHNQSVPPRSTRFFYLQHHWFAETREGVTLGPFEHTEEGQVALNAYIDFITRADEQTKASYLKFVETGGVASQRMAAV